MSAYMQGSGISIGSATGTRLDSAAKHIMACRVHTNLIKKLLTNGVDADRELMRDKHRYCVTKDEMVVNVTTPLFANGLSVSRSAYPLITSHLSQLDLEARNFLSDLYSKQTPMQFDNCLNTASSNLPPTSHKRYLPFCTFQGYSLGTAWASDKTGDTVCSVIIGGMVTVRNGAFPMQTGQMVQWYFDFEEEKFSHAHHQENEVGSRHLHNDARHPSRFQEQISAKRQKFNDERDYGMPIYGTSGDKTSEKSKTVFRIKPYKMYRHNGTISDHYGDKIRVFGKCLGCAEPWGFVDVMLMTQSL